MSLLFPNVNSILIPKKVAYALQKYVPKKSLKTIDSNPFIAVEKCLVFLSNLASTIYTDEKWKALYSPLLHEQTKDKDNTFLYKKIVEVLVNGTNNGPILEVDTRYHDGSSMKYKLADPYLKAGLTEYILRTPKIIQVRNKLYYRQLSKALNNPIALNLVKIYSKLDLPTSEELLEIGKGLVKNGYMTKKGKKLTVRNKHQNHYWTDHNERSFVEDNIKLFEYLTHRGFMIPIQGDDKSGGRVVDSFTLMPSWIRNQITIEGMPLKEADFVALHPNIAMTLYGGKGEYLNHEKIADAIGEDIKVVKVEHLSFFNKRIGQMKKSTLYDYYQMNEPDALRNIEEDKRKHGYKITSRKFFKTEVEIMTKAITELNAEGIHVLYVYDALLCEEKDLSRVQGIMNAATLEFGVKTSVKEVNPIVQSQKYHLTDEVDLYEILPNMGLTVKESMMVIHDFNCSKIRVKDLVLYIGKQRKEQVYNDYKGVSITQTLVNRLKNMVVN
ncbi:hypothetical protein ACI6PS_07535 [Flavobacterium sp. PLA-1-15]|uniref:hypothetical protein n=1 Tax=Flavobacterium sp. PLA-1-15 TaxID=3380533 RepID=UPI003B7F6289